MKKILIRLALPLLVLIGLVSTLPAEEIYVETIHFLDVDTTLDDYFNIKYDTEYDEIFIQKGDPTSTSWIILNNEQIESFRATVSKALDWCKIAHDNNAEVQKEIPNSKLESYVVWEVESNMYTNRDDRLQLLFFFISTKDAIGEIVPTVLIFSSTIKASENENVLYTFPRACLLEEDLKTLNDAISKESIANAVAKYESKKTEDLFN